MYEALVGEGARGILDVYVTSVTRDPEENRVTVDWELGVTSSSNPQREDLMRSYNKGIVAMAYVDPEDSLIKLTGRNFVLGNNGTMANFLEPIVGQFGQPVASFVLCFVSAFNICSTLVKQNLEFICRACPLPLPILSPLPPSPPPHRDANSLAR